MYNIYIGRYNRSIFLECSVACLMLLQVFVVQFFVVLIPILFIFSFNSIFLSIIFNIVEIFFEYLNQVKQ